MCDHDRAARLPGSLASSGPLATPRPPAPTPAPLPLFGTPRAVDLSQATADEGSRRRRLWDLSSQAHCPVIGVCLPLTVLRTLMRKTLGTAGDGDDYDIHCGAVSRCAARSPIAERLQRELDRRHARALREAARLRTTPALLDWWNAQRFEPDVAGALWASLTHPRCRATLEDRILRDIHMQQHQLGATERIDARRLIALSEENAILTRELGAIQARTSALLGERNQLLEQRQAELLQARAALVGCEAQNQALRGEIAALESALPDLRPRLEQARRIEAQLARIHELERDLLRTRHRLQQMQTQASRDFGLTPGSAPASASASASVSVTGSMPDSGSASGSASGPASGPASLRAGTIGSDGVTVSAVSSGPVDPGTRLTDKSVLCVGGRPASVPFYRHIIERQGGRFLHHDGGLEDNSGRLDSSLSAADLVICHTGCLSHGAYWRVKDHCKRTGTRCVFVDNPSRASLQRALAGLAMPAGDVDD